MKHIVDEIRRISTKLGVHPSQLSKASFLNNTETVKEWDLRKNGGMNSIIAANFPQSDKDLKTITESAETKSYIKKLEKRLGTQELTEERILDAIDLQITPLPKIQGPRTKSTPTDKPRDVVGMLNDTHYGLVVNPDEIGDLNSFNWVEASRRTALFIRQALEYKVNRRPNVEKFHLLLNGDIIAGVIHGLGTKGIDLLIYQVNGALHILTHAVAALLREYPNVEVTGVAGNHCDAIHKREHGKRAISEKYDSYTNFVYYALSVAFRDNPRVSFNFPKTPYAFINLIGGRTMLCHGDTLFSKALGNPGDSINVKRLGDSIQRFNVGEVAKGKKPVRLVLFGHVHTKAHFTTSDGVEVYVAPSLSGTDSFAHSIDINTNQTGQVIFESTEKYILGDSRLIRVSEADKDSSLDEIIPCYKQTLRWEK